MQNKSTFTGANILFFVFSLLFLFFQFILVGFTIVYGMDFLINNFYYITLASEIILILLPVVIYTLFKKLNVKEVFRLRWPGWTPLGTVVLLSVPAYFTALMLNNIVAFLLQFFGKLPDQKIPIPQTVPELLFSLVIIALTPAICEEAMHRGIMLSSYEKRGSIKAVIASAILFGFFHFDLTNLAGPIFLGILIGYYVIRTNSIFAGILAHLLNNTIAMLLTFFTRSSQPAEPTIMTFSELIYLCGFGAAGLLFIWLLLKLFRKTTKRKYLMIPSLGPLKNDIKTFMSHWPIIAILILYILTTMMLLFSIAAGI